MTTKFKERKSHESLHASFPLDTSELSRPSQPTARDNDRLYCIHVLSSGPMQLKQHFRKKNVCSEHTIRRAHAKRQLFNWEGQMLPVWDLSLVNSSSLVLHSAICLEPNPGSRKHNPDAQKQFPRKLTFSLTMESSVSSWACSSNSFFTSQTRLVRSYTFKNMRDLQTQPK